MLGVRREDTCEAATSAGLRYDLDMRTYYLHLALALSFAFAAAACGCSKGSSQPQATTPPPSAAPMATAQPPAPTTTPGAQGGPSCEQVADHVLEVAVTSDEYKTATPEQQKTVKEKMPEFRQDLVKQCSEQGWPADVKGCVMQAKAMREMESCEPVTR